MSTNPKTSSKASIICSYCGNYAKFVADGGRLYQSRTNYGPVWVCEPCTAWVGCHPGTTWPLGRLANAKLRRLKIEAHKEFDPLWSAKMRRTKCSKSEARSAAYAWLAKQLGISGPECHIGLFDESQCERVIEICRNAYEKYRLAER